MNINLSGDFPSIGLPVDNNEIKNVTTSSEDIFCDCSKYKKLLYDQYVTWMLVDDASDNEFGIWIYYGHDLESDFEKFSDNLQHGDHIVALHDKEIFVFDQNTVTINSLIPDDEDFCYDDSDDYVKDLNR